MAKKPLPSIDEIRQLLDYDPETGRLTWKPRDPIFFLYMGARKAERYHRWWNARYAGTEAGAFDRLGYITVKINDKSYLGHRLIWALVYGEWPETIDHINGQTGDNRLCNLRDVSREINQRNQKRHSSNTSGRTGVRWSDQHGAWTATIKMNDVSYTIGVFDDFDAAVSARKAVERQNGFTGRQ